MKIRITYEMKVLSLCRKFCVFWQLFWLEFGRSEKSRFSRKICVCGELVRLAENFWKKTFRKNFGENNRRKKESSENLSEDCRKNCRKNLSSEEFFVGRIVVQKFAVTENLCFLFADLIRVWAEKSRFFGVCVFVLGTVHVV